MAHIGQELALGLRGRLRPRLGLPKILLQLPPACHVPEIEDGGPGATLGVADRPGEPLQPHLLRFAATCDEPELPGEVLVRGIIIEDPVQESGRRPIVCG